MYDDVTGDLIFEDVPDEDLTDEERELLRDTEYVQGLVERYKGIFHN